MSWSQNSHYAISSMLDICTILSMVGTSTGIKTLSSEYFSCQTPKSGVACLSHPHSFTSELTAPPALYDAFFWKQHITDSPSVHCHVPDVTSMGHLIGAAPPSQGKPLQDTPSVLSIAHMGPPSMSGHFEPVIHTCSLGRLRFAAHFFLPHAKWRLKGPTSAPA